MLQKFKKGYLTDLIFFIILAGGVWLLYEKRAKLVSTVASKLTKTNLKVDKIVNDGLWSLKLCGISSSYFFIDTLWISTSPLDIIRFHFKRISVNGFQVYVDSIFKNSEKVSKRSKGTIKFYDFPLFVRMVTLKNTTLYYRHDTIYIKNLKSKFNGRIRKFFARLILEGVKTKNFNLEFFKSNIYGKGKSIKIENGELRSNIFCVEKLIGSYDSTINLNFSGISFNNNNIMINNASISTSPKFNNIKLNMDNVEFLNRTIRKSTLDLIINQNTFKYKFTLASDWLSLQGGGTVNNKKTLSYVVYINRLSYDEKGAHFKGRVFLKGTKDRLRGIVSVYRSSYRNRNTGSIKGFFKFRRPFVLTLDSVLIYNNKSFSILNGIITPDSQFIHIFPDIHIEDYDNKISGHLKGEILARVLKGKKFFTDANLILSNFHSSHINTKSANINVHSLSEDSISANIQMLKVKTIKGLDIDTLLINTTIAEFSLINYNLFVITHKAWVYLKGAVYAKEGEYTGQIDTVYGSVNNMHVFSERGSFIYFKHDTLYLATGRLYIGDGMLRMQGILDITNKNVNLFLVADSLVLPYIKGQRITLSTVTRVSGPLSNPIFISEGNIHGLRAYGISAQDITYSFNFSGHTLSIEKLKISYNDGGMQIQGGIVFPTNLYTLKLDSLILDVTVKLKNFDVTPLFSYISDVYSIEYAGVEGEVSLKGKLKQPFLSGELQIKGQNGYLQPVGIRTDNINGYIQFLGKDLVIKSLRAESDAGEIIAFGKIRSTNGFLDSPDINISAREVYLEIGSEINALCDADMSLIRGQKSPLLLKGDVKVKEGYLFAEFQSPPSTSTQERNPILTLHLNISWDKNVYLLNEIAEIEFSGTLLYNYDPSGMLLNGNLTVLGGSFSYFDRMFKVEDGKVVFNNLSQIEPELNINASSMVDSYTVRLNISGTLREPVITLTSSPPLDESNIIALLTFGKLLSEGGSEVLSTTLLEKKALGFAQSYLTRSISRKLGLRELEVSSGSIEEDPHLSVGFYVTRDIYLKYYHDFLSVQYDRFDLRYRISKYFGLNAIRDDEGRYYFGLSFEKRF